MKNEGLTRLELTAGELTAIVAEKYGHTGGRMRLAFDKDSLKDPPNSELMDDALVGIVFEFPSNAPRQVLTRSGNNLDADVGP